ncbi:MAG: hypothetical protein ABJC10_05435 [Acidobacteriota bacterium]
MIRFAFLALAVLIGCASLACQSYSTGLQTGVTRADETAALGALRTIATVQQTYSVSNSGNYATFQQLVAGDYLDSRFNSEKPALRDYVLTMTVGSDSGGPYYRCNADPIPPKEGTHYYIDSSANALHINQSQPASASDPLQP